MPFAFFLLKKSNEPFSILNTITNLLKIDKKIQANIAGETHTLLSYAISKHGLPYDLKSYLDAGFGLPNNMFITELLLKAHNFGNMREYIKKENISRNVFAQLMKKHLSFPTLNQSRYINSFFNLLAHDEMKGPPSWVKVFNEEKTLAYMFRYYTGIMLEMFNMMPECLVDLKECIAQVTVPDSEDAHGNSILHSVLVNESSTQADRERMVLLLVECGMPTSALDTIKNKDGKTPLALCKSNKTLHKKMSDLVENKTKRKQPAAEVKDEAKAGATKSKRQRRK